MIIIKIQEEENKFHYSQSQSHRTSCWLDGYIEVPVLLEQKLVECQGYCDLIIKENILIDIIPYPELIPKPEPKITQQDDIDAMMVDHEYRITLLELGVN